MVKLDIGNGKAILGAVLLTSGKAGEFDPIAHQVTELPDSGRRNEAARNKIMLKDVGNPFRILGICFLATNGLNVFGVGQNDVAIRFKDIVDRMPVFTGGFHTDIQAAMSLEPGHKPPEVSGESREAMLFVGSDTFVICGRDARNNKGFVDINSTADRINDFECHVLYLTRNIWRIRQ